MSEKEKYMTKTELKKRGWNDELIGKYLPEPYVTKNPYYSRMSMYLWKEKDVLEAEQNEEFLDRLEKRNVYQKRAAAAVRTKEEKMRVILNAAIEHIKVEEHDYEEVVKRALKAKQNWYDITDQYDRDVRNADSRTVQRWTVNYIRHNLTDYDEFLYNAKGKTGILFAYPLYRRAVLDRISDAYPYLCEECERQKGDR
jgi:hypothetical protein